jgi:two-component system, OmpR family, response regulator RegX3
MSGSTPTVVVTNADELTTCALLSELRREHLDVTTVRTHSDALRVLNDVKPDVFVLGVGLGSGTEIELCRTVRSHAQTPILVWSSDDNENDLVAYLEAGADMFVVSPSPRLMLARIRALHRRCGREPITEIRTVLAVEDLEMDLEAHQVRVGSTPITLRPMEFRLLEILLTNAGRVVNRHALIDQVWGTDYFGSTRTLDVHIRRLRTKIQRGSRRWDQITTIRGVGYRYELASPAVADAVADAS